MDEAKELQRLKNEGYDPVWVYEAQPGEVDETHDHDYETKLVILKGSIGIRLFKGGGTEDVSGVVGSEVIIPRNELHSAEVAAEGCRYIVGEKH